MTPSEANSTSSADIAPPPECILPDHKHGRRKRILVFGIGLVALAAAFSARPLFDSWKAQQVADFRKKELQYRVNCLAAYDEQHWKKVELIAREWTKWNANTSDGWLLLGDALQKQADYAGAVNALLMVPKTSHKAVPSYLEASHIQFGMAGQPREGVETCRRILTIEPSCMDAWRRIIFFYAITLERAEMLQEIQNAIRAGGAPREAYVYLVLADHLMFTNGFELASRWSTAQPDDDLFTVARAIHLNEILDRAEDQDAEPQFARDARRKSLRDMLSQFPQNTQLLRFFLSQSLLDVQVTQVGQLLAMLPDVAASDSVFWRIRGWYLKEQGQLQQAAEAYRTSLELHAFDWRARFELSEVERQLGNTDEARELRSVGLLGKELRKELVQLPNATEVSPELLKQIEFYARRCGDRGVADAIRVQFFQN